MLDEKGLNAQRRFPMVAVDGGFCNFEPIPRKLLKDAKNLMRQYDADVKLLTVKAEAKSLYNNYTRKLIELLPDAENRQAIALQIEKKIITNNGLIVQKIITGWKKILNRMTSTLHLFVLQ